jgi:hypothetical protein
LKSVVQGIILTSEAEKLHSMNLLPFWFVCLFIGIGLLVSVLILILLLHNVLLLKLQETQKLFILMDCQKLF